MNIEIYNRLVELARARRLTTYSEIAPLAGLSMANDIDRERIAQLLGEIFLHEFNQQHPALTSIVVHRGNDNNPGEGFFAISEELGLYNGSRDPLSRLEFWVHQVQDVHGFWQAN